MTMADLSLLSLRLCEECPASVVQLATRDINLQTKMEFAKLPYMELPNH